MDEKIQKIAIVGHGLYLDAIQLIYSAISKENVTVVPIEELNVPKVVIPVKNTIELVPISKIYYPESGQERRRHRRKQKK